MNEDFAMIEAGVSAAEHEIERLTGLMDRLTVAGMWPRVPREEWQSRGMRVDAYLYMCFAKGPDGRYSGPGGVQKVYIGCEVAAILEAQAKATRRAEYEALERKLRTVRAARAFLAQKLAAAVGVASQIVAGEWDLPSRLF